MDQLACDAIVNEPIIVSSLSQNMCFLVTIKQSGIISERCETLKKNCSLGYCCDIDLLCPRLLFLAHNHLNCSSRLTRETNLTQILIIYINKMEIIPQFHKLNLTSFIFVIKKNVCRTESHNNEWTIQQYNLLEPCIM